MNQRRMGLYTRIFESPGIFNDLNASGKANVHSLIFIPFMLVQIPPDRMKQTYAKQVVIANILDRVDELDVYYRKKRKLQEQATTATTKKNASKTEPFLHLKAAPKEAGPRESIWLEGKRQFNRGLFSTAAASSKK
jgi:hypothetical protein